MSFEQAYTQYFNKIYQRCLYALFFDEKQAYQITEDVFVLLWKRWSTVPKGKIEGWLRKTAKQKIYKLQASHTRAQSILSFNPEILPDHMQTADVIDQIIDEKVTRNTELYAQQVYARLKPEEVALAEYIRQGRHYREIAELMGTTEGAVSMRVTRLKRKVEKLIEAIIEGIL